MNITDVVKKLRTAFRQLIAPTFYCILNFTKELLHKSIKFHSVPKIATVISHMNRKYIYLKWQKLMVIWTPWSYYFKTIT